jgi:hypothetical protein
MKWIPVLGFFLAKWPIPGKQWNWWFRYQVISIVITVFAWVIVAYYVFK